MKHPRDKRARAQQTDESPYPENRFLTGTRPEERTYGPAIGIVIIVGVLAAGGFSVWKQTVVEREQQTANLIATTTIEIFEDSTTTTPAAE